MEREEGGGADRWRERRGVGRWREEGADRWREKRGGGLTDGERGGGGADRWREGG